MTDLSTTDVQSRTITAFFDTRPAAQKAADDLVAAGIPRQHIQITGDGAATGTGTTGTRDAKSFWDELKDMFLPDEDRYGYAEGLRRGGILLAVKSDEATYTQIYDILDRDGAVNMDEREASWRATGWSGYQSGMTTGAATRDMGSSTTATGVSGLAANAATATTRQQTRPTGTAATETLREGADEVIPVYEETAAVAKRDVNHGRVRLRSYVVETPFSEQVNLRSEQVQVERRPVNRTVSATEAAFQDRVIEAEEHVEEAILAKETRVKEEISLRKTVENQAQTVAGTLRHTEVDVEDTRSGHAVAGVGGVGASRVDASRIVEHMPVLDSDGAQVGTVDHMDGPDRIKLAKSTSPDGAHHFVPLGWVDHVDTHVHLNKTGAQVRAGW